jgi:hypothetical protein
LEINGIESVYAMATALTINKKASAKWEQILPLVLKTLGADSAEIAQQLATAATTTSTTAETSTATSATSGQVRIRMQISNKIPIQIEAIGFLGTVQRMKLSQPKFQDHMELLMQKDLGIDFFAGRKWVDRGIRYLLTENDDDDDSTSTAISTITDSSPNYQERVDLELALQAEVAEVDAAYSPERLEAIVADILGEKNIWQQQPTISTSIQELDLETVDHYCDLAEKGDMEALSILANFVSSSKAKKSARRNALAFLGGTGGGTTTSENVADLVFHAIVSALQNEKNPAMRRTAGDALSDLGDSRAVPFAVKALEDDRSKLVQWRAARVIGELGDANDIVAVLKQALFSSNKKYAFEVAFEIKDALRKVKARVLQMSTRSSIDDTDGIINGAPKTGPVWKQIQEGAGSFSTDNTNNDA